MMRTFQLAVLLTLHCCAAALCFAEDGEGQKFGGAMVGGIGGPGGTPQSSPSWASGGTWATGAHSFGYFVGYREELHRLFSGSITYVNQGHYDRHGHSTPHHSRDDIQAEFLVGKRLADSRFDFKLGGGAAYYSETDIVGPGRYDFLNRHSFGFVVSGVVDVDVTNRVFAEARVHRHFLFDRFDSTNVMFGVGFRVRPSSETRGTTGSEAQADPASEKSKHAVRLNYGLGRLNSAYSETLDGSFQLAYEVDFSKRFAGSISYLREGSAPEMNRRGLAIQGETKQQISRLLTLGLGLGPYINVDQSDFFHRKGKVSVDALFTAFIDLKVTRNAEVSLSISRPRSLTTLENKPMTDVVLTGLKLRF